MHISKVTLVNYRNFANANFKFNKGINTIIGENGCGKTNLFRAMRLLLEDVSYQFAYKLNENDFNRKKVPTANNDEILKDLLLITIRI